jgi:plasmid stabilization system protein ParE
MAKMNWTDEAEKWLRDIHDYIAQDNPMAAKPRFIARTLEMAFL